MGINASLDNDGKVNELVEMIDRLISNGSGQLVIDVDELSDNIKVSTLNSTDCGRKGACCQPTEELDDEED